MSDAENDDNSLTFPATEATFVDILPLKLALAMKVPSPRMVSVMLTHGCEKSSRSIVMRAPFKSGLMVVVKCSSVESMKP